MSKQKKMKAKNNLQIPSKKHEPGTPPIILIDGMNIAHAAYHSYRNLSFKGESVAMMFGMPQMVRTLIQKNFWRPDNIVIIWDGLRNPKRTEWLPTYKSHRDLNRTPEEREVFMAQIRKVRKIFYALGITQIHDKNVEGDDMMGIAVEHYAKLSRVIIVSGDKDMGQFINRDITVYNQRDSTINTPELLRAHIGVFPNQVVDYLSLLGDESDDIPGYRGIGPVKAAKFLEQFGSINFFLDSSKASYPGIDKDKLRKLYKLNRKMIDIKWFIKKFHPGLELKYYKKQRYPKFREKRFDDICRKYRFKTMLTDTFKNFYKNLQTS